MLTSLLAAPLILASMWAAAALWFDGSQFASVAFSVLAAGALIRIKPFRRGLLGVGVLCLAVIAWWLTLQPSNDRVWLPDVARPPAATFDGDRVTIHNVRNFEYRSETDYDEHWEDRTFDLSRLRGVDLFLVYWGSPWIAHTILSWEFEEGPPLAISIETRKEQGEAYSAVLGFFRQFELYYVVADERDLVGLRTHHRGEDVYLYRLSTPVETAREILVDYLEEIDRLTTKPRWYNAATHNCTTAIRYHAKNVAAQNPWDWRILVNGRLDELSYERGTIDTSMPFAQLKQLSFINPRVSAKPIGPDFSRRIREGLPALRDANRTSGSRLFPRTGSNS